VIIVLIDFKLLKFVVDLLFGIYLECSISYLPKTYSENMLISNKYQLNNCILAILHFSINNYFYY